jgi:hypothetical protein
MRPLREVCVQSEEIENLIAAPARISTIYDVTILR